MYKNCYYLGDWVHKHFNWCSCSWYQTFKASQKIATVGEYGWKGWMAKFGCYCGDRAERQSLYLWHQTRLEMGLAMMIDNDSILLILPLLPPKLHPIGVVRDTSDLNSHLKVLFFKLSHFSLFSGSIPPQGVSEIVTLLLLLWINAPLRCVWNCHTSPTSLDQCPLKVSLKLPHFSYFSGSMPP